MLIGMLAWLGAALLFDAWLRRRGVRPRRERAADGSIGRAMAERAPSTPVLDPHAVDEDLSDDELVARVRATVDIPPGVEVTAVEGAIVLFGRVPRFAFASLLSRVAGVPGVVDIEDRLTPVDDFGASENA
jgi:hypothetical protein